MRSGGVRRVQHFLDYTEKEINELEIGLAGVAAAITSAVHHATGVRVRELPIQLEDLLCYSESCKTLSRSDSEYEVRQQNEKGPEVLPALSPTCAKVGV